MTDIEQKYVNNIIEIAQRTYHINNNIEAVISKCVQSLDLSDPMMGHVTISKLADNIIRQLK